jgi:hypothetical protein
MPEPIPQSIIPALILAAIVPHDYKPDEHSLLTDIIGVLSGIPAISCAILKCIYPEPTIKLLPTQIS